MKGEMAIALLIFVFAFCGASCAPSGVAKRAADKTPGGTEAGIVYLFPNGTSKVEDAFLAAYRHFEHTCVHAPLVAPIRMGVR